MSKNIAYVLDFDGTITTLDVSTMLSQHFGREKFHPINNAYRRGEFGMRGWLDKLSVFLPGNMKELILVALEYAIIREGLKEFLEYARDNSRPVYIASDGFGFYIEPILTESGLIDYFQKIYCNKIVVEEKENVSILLPYGHRTCRICGNCKAYHVVNLKRMGYRVIYVGDGTNDRFGASHSDLVFARDRLANYLNEINTCFLYWNNFFDLLKVDEKHEIGSVLSSLCEPEGNGIIME